MSHSCIPLLPHRRKHTQRANFIATICIKQVQRCTKVVTAFFVVYPGFTTATDGGGKREGEQVKLRRMNYYFTCNRFMAVSRHPLPFGNIEVHL